MALCYVSTKTLSEPEERDRSDHSVLLGVDRNGKTPSVSAAFVKEAD